MGREWVANGREWKGMSREGIGNGRVGKVCLQPVRKAIGKMFEAHYCASKLDNGAETRGSAFCEIWLDDSWLMIRAGYDSDYDSDYLPDSILAIFPIKSSRSLL